MRTLCACHHPLSPSRRRNAGLAHVTPRKTTKPRSPKLSTRSRARPAEAAPPAEPFSAFKARPMPGSTYSPAASPRRPPSSEPRQVTQPKPFNLTQVNRHSLDAEKHKARLAREEAAAAAARQFRARPMPVGEGFAVAPSGKALASAKPFDLSTNNRGGLKSARTAQRRASDEAAAKALAAFKAKV